MYAVTGVGKICIDNKILMQRECIVSQVTAISQQMVASQTTTRVSTVMTLQTVSNRILYNLLADERKLSLHKI